MCFFTGMMIFLREVGAEGKAACDDVFQVNSLWLKRSGPITAMKVTATSWCGKKQGLHSTNPLSLLLFLYPPLSFLSLSLSSSLSNPFGKFIPTDITLSKITAHVQIHLYLNLPSKPWYSQPNLDRWPSRSQWECCQYQGDLEEKNNQFYDRMDRLKITLKSEWNNVKYRLLQPWTAPFLH